MMKLNNTGILLTIALGCALATGDVLTATPILEGTNWKLTAWTGKTPLKETELTATFTKTTLTGSAGCNRYTTNYQTKENTVSVNPAIATTRKACPEPWMKQEAQFLGALQGVQQYAITAKGELQLVYRSDDGLGILTFTPAPKVTRSEKTIWVNSQKKPCTGVAPQECLQIKEKPDDEWKLFYNSIEGFDFKPGFQYRLKVAIEKIENPAADKSSESWKLLEIISQTPEKETPRGWLDRPLNNWNKPNAPIPKSPVKTVLDNQCRSQVREAVTFADKALMKAGWLLFGPVQTYGKTSIILAMSAVDGMCRPMGYQEFVFVEGKFVGTLSPRPMDSRSDGASQRTILQNSDRIVTVFNRYRDTDPLCCPSQLSRVIYQIETKNGVSIVVPQNVETEATRS
jgi:heat shock protein HslJ